GELLAELGPLIVVEGHRSAGVTFPETERRAARARTNLVLVDDRGEDLRRQLRHAVKRRAGVGELAGSFDDERVRMHRVAERDRTRPAGRADEDEAQLIDRDEEGLGLA